MPGPHCAEPIMGLRDHLSIHASRDRSVSRAQICRENCSNTARERNHAVKTARSARHPVFLESEGAIGSSAWRPDWSSSGRGMSRTITGTATWAPFAQPPVPGESSQIPPSPDRQRIAAPYRSQDPVRALAVPGDRSGRLCRSRRPARRSVGTGYSGSVKYRSSKSGSRRRSRPRASSARA